MLAVIAQLNDYDTHIPYDYRDGIDPTEVNSDLGEWPIYDDDQMDRLKERLTLVGEDCLSEGIRAVFTIVKIKGTPAAMEYDFIYQPTMSDLFEEGAEVFASDHKKPTFNNPELLLSFRASISSATEEEVRDKIVTEEEFAASELVEDMEIIDNLRKPIAIYSSGIWGIMIVEANDEYVIYSESDFAFHKADVIDGEYFMVGSLKVPLNECQRV